jgi:tetratricopeptide (TPR) repeat protein
MIDPLPVLLRFFLVPLPLGAGLWWLAQAGLAAPAPTLGFWLGAWVLDWLTLPAQSRFWYRRGQLRLALAGWLVRLTGAATRRRRTTLAAEAAWILLDLEQEGPAAHLLARHGTGSVERDPRYAVALARTLLAQKARPLLAMDLADTALEECPMARAHYVRGLCYEALDEPRPALRAFSMARHRAALEHDQVLTGFCYFHLGLTWGQLGERDYALDHFLRAEIMLFFLPSVARRARAQLTHHG